MSYFRDVGFQKRFQLFSFLLLTCMILFVHCESEYLSTHDILSKLRPLKYAKHCKELCENIICQPIQECENGVILKNESYCNCCEACVKFLDIGQSCKDTIKGSLAIGPQSRCKRGTTCKNGKCELDSSVDNSCLLKRDIRKKHNETGMYAEDLWIPQCDEEGNFTPKQRKVEKSICVDELGNRIFGSADVSFKNTCACSRYMQKKAQEDTVFYNVNPQEHCSPSGSFDSLQCINNLCYCADTNTGEVKSQLVRLDFLDKLECYNHKIHRRTYLKDCEVELQRSRRIAYEFWKKGVKLLGTDRVICDPDGTFSPTQCLPERCVCTSKEGIGIRTYQKEIEQALKAKMSCNCARDESSSPLMPFSCQTDGSYSSITCFRDECVCVDEDGERISQKLKDLDNNSCIGLIKKLSEYPEDLSTEDPDYD